jgi:TonB family protein
VDAQYPTSALASGRHADVVLIVTIDTDGHVSKVDVAQSAGKDLDEAAIAAMRQWTFRPATRAGRPVPSRIRVPFHFAPPGGAPEGPTGGVPPGTVQGGVTSGAGGGVGTSGPSPESLEGPPPVVGEPEEVRVRGRPQPPSRGASDFNLQIGELSRVPRGNASEMLKLAPGILLTNEGGEGHAEQVFMRGFDAREGQDIELTMGGVPINESGNLHGNGYADTHFIIPELVERLRVVEGPFDPRQGNYAVAGSADYQLGLAKRGLTAKYMTGSFGTQRALLTWGPK